MDDSTSCVLDKNSGSCREEKTLKAHTGVRTLVVTLLAEFIQHSVHEYRSSWISWSESPWT